LAVSQRAQFAETMLRIMAEDEKIVVLLGDVGVFGFREHADRWPERVMNMGCCEQAMVSFGAGLAPEGLYPVISTIDPFLVRRAYEQIRLDLGGQGLGACLVTVGHNRDYSTMGESHWCPEGADMMRAVPGMQVFEPDNAWLADQMLMSACERRALAYVRLRA
jgi:transketolase